jgi:NTE family protein
MAHHPGNPGRTAFVFAGGGSLGAVQVGMLQELVQAGERPDFVVGASVGALNACYFAGSPDLDGVGRLADIWRRLKGADIFPLSVRGAFGWLSGSGSLFDPSGLRRMVGKHVPFANLEDAAIPVHVVATDLGGVPVCLSSGSAIDAVLASAAIPIVFPSVRIGEHDLIDGAIAGNTPILTAVELGATRIIVLPTGFACSLQAPPSGAAARGLHALNLLVAHQMVRDLKLLAGLAEIHVVPNLCPLDVSPFNFLHSHKLIERAAESTRRWIEAEGLTRQFIPGALFAHHHADGSGTCELEHGH